MIEKVFNYSLTDEKAVERIIMDDHVNLIHMVFNQNEGLPEHFSNANLYMTIIRGILSINLDDQGIHEYHKGEIIQIPMNVKMNVNNLHKDVMEMFVTKAPAPVKA